MEVKNIKNKPEKHMEFELHAFQQKRSRSSNYTFDYNFFYLDR